MPAFCDLTGQKFGRLTVGLLVAELKGKVEPKKLNSPPAPCRFVSSPR